MSAVFSPQTLFEEISSFVEHSNVILERGDILELAGLDLQVEKLCLEVLNLSQEQRLLYADRLQKLLADLTVLGASMSASQSEIAAEITHLNSHQKANIAYKTADATDGFGPKIEEE